MNTNLSTAVILRRTCAKNRFYCSYTVILELVTRATPLPRVIVAKRLFNAGRRFFFHSFVLRHQANNSAEALRAMFVNSHCGCKSLSGSRLERV